MRTERLATIVRRVLLAESKAERSAPRVKLLSEEGMDEELVAFVDSDIEPDSASLQSHQNFSVTSMTADDIKQGRDPRTGAKSLEDQLRDKRRALRSPGFRKTAERMYGEGRLDLPILLIEATHLINNAVIRRFMLTSVSSDDLKFHKEGGGLGAEHIQADSAGRHTVTLRNQATPEAQSFLLQIATRELESAVSAFNEGRGAKGGEMVISEDDVPKLVQRGVVEKSGEALSLSPRWHEGVVTVLLCNPSSSNTAITPAAFKALTFSRGHAAGEERTPSFIRWDRTTPWLAVHRVIDALRSEQGAGAGKLNPLNQLQSVDYARVKEALERTVITSGTEYALLKRQPNWRAGDEGTREARVNRKPGGELIRIATGVPIGAGSDSVPEGQEIGLLLPAASHEGAAKRFARSYRGVASGAMGDRALLEAALRFMAAKTRLTVRVVSESEVSTSNSVTNAAYGDMTDFLFTHAIQMGSARGYRDKGVGLLPDDIIPEAVVDSMYNRARGGLRVNPDFLQDVRPMSGYIGSVPTVTMSGVSPRVYNVYTGVVSPSMIGYSSLGRNLAVSSQGDYAGGLESNIAETIRSFLKSCAEELRRAGNTQLASQIADRLFLNTTFSASLISDFCAPFAREAAQIVRAGSALFYPVKSKTSDEVVVGAVRRNARVNRDDKAAAEAALSAVMEFKSKVDAVANHLVTGEEIPGLSERTASQDLQLVGRVWVG